MRRKQHRFPVNGSNTIVLLLFAAIVLAAASSAASAERNPSAMTGDNFLQACSKADPEFIGFCHGFVQGAHDAWADTLCVPSHVTRAQLVTWTVELLQLEPGLRELYAAAVVIAVIKRRFPCPKDDAGGG